MPDQVLSHSHLGGQVLELLDEVGWTACELDLVDELVEELRLALVIQLLHSLLQGLEGLAREHRRVQLRYSSGWQGREGVEKLGCCTGDICQVKLGLKNGKPAPNSVVHERWRLHSNCSNRRMLGWGGLVRLDHNPRRVSTRRVHHGQALGSGKLGTGNR